MTRADQLARRLGQNMSESLGVRGPVANDLPPQAHAAPGAAAAHGDTPEDGRSRDRQAGLLELSRITPDPDQPRKTFDEEALSQLAESLKTTGQLQPIRVRWSQALGKWVIISGERRYRAAHLAGMKALACQFVEQSLSETEVRQQSLIENLLREDLRPIEAAQGYRQLMDLNGWTIQQVADALSIAKGTVSKALALLKLPEDIRAQVEEGRIAPTAAYEISRVEGEGAQRELARRVVDEGIRRDDTGQLVGKTARPKAKKSKAAAPSTTKVFEVQGAKLSITWPKGYVSPEEIIAALSEALGQLTGRAA
jgi:ParB family chromosome partitioning protein